MYLNSRDSRNNDPSSCFVGLRIQLVATKHLCKGLLGRRHLDEAASFFFFSFPWWKRDWCFAGWGCPILQESGLQNRSNQSKPSGDLKLRPRFPCQKRPGLQSQKRKGRRRQRPAVTAPRCRSGCSWGSPVLTCVVPRKPPDSLGQTQVDRKPYKKKRGAHLAVSFHDELEGP